MEIINGLSVDVEDYFQVSAFRNVIKREEWNRIPSRVVNNTQKILDIFEKVNVKATFFVLGWVAKHFPEIVKRIKKAGHEIGSHGYDHRLLTTQTADEFESDLKLSIYLIEDIIGEAVEGYRAPSYSITNETEWALEILIECGIKYDSSVYPIHHDYGGMPNAKSLPHQIREGLWEIPLSSINVFGTNLPFGGGGYFRLYPYWLTSWLTKIKNKKGEPIVVYVHPWEVDWKQPRILSASWRSRFRHYQNLRHTEKRIIKLCQEFRFLPLKEALELWTIKKTKNEVMVSG